MQQLRQFGIAVAQFAPGDDSAVNLAAIREYALRARDAGAGLLVAPEYSSRFRQPFDAQLAGQAEALDGPFVTGLAHIATETGLHLVSGMLERREDADEGTAGDQTNTVGAGNTDGRVDAVVNHATPRRFGNTVVAISPQGERVAVYRKQHLYDAFGAQESKWVVPGELVEPQIFAAGGFRVGLQTCYDLRFPELSRRLVDAGAEVLLVPAQWLPGPGKELHWRTLASARAIENTVYLAAADHAAPAGIGRSMIIDPRGEILAELGEEPGLVTAVARGDLLDEVRRINPALAARRYAVLPLLSSVLGADTPG